MKKNIGLLILLFCFCPAGGARENNPIAFTELFRPNKIFVEKDKIYVSENDVIKVFSLGNPGSPHQLTQQGEGPGEFRYSPGLTFLPDYIVATGNGKLVFYPRNGGHFTEKKAPSTMRLFPVKDHYIGSRMEMDNKLKKFVRKDSLYDENFKKIIDLNATIDENALVIDTSGKLPKQVRYMVPHGYGVITDGKHICLYDSKRGFYMEIYDSGGRKINTIKKNFPKIPVPGPYKKKRMDELKKEKGWEKRKAMFEFDFPGYFPAFRQVFLNGGMLYVLADMPDIDGQSLMVMDLRGKIVKRTVVPDVSPRYFYGGKLYYFLESPDGEWMLHVRRLI